jgi:hypothetical protein
VRPRGALCGCCENTLLWDVETVLYGHWRVGQSRLLWRDVLGGRLVESVDYLLSCQSAMYNYGWGWSTVLAAQNDLKICEKTIYCNSLRVIVDFIGSSDWSLRCENCRCGGRLCKEAGCSWPLDELWQWLFVCSHLPFRFYWDEESSSRVANVVNPSVGIFLNYCLENYIWSDC